MAFPLAAIPVIGELFSGLFKTVDEVHTSQEEKLAIQQQIFGMQVALTEKFIDFQSRLVEAQAKVIEAEAKSDSWIARNWRPITMLTFVGLVVNRWTGLLPLFGFPQIDIPPEIEAQLWTVVQIGLGGYVAGRSVEKVAEVVGHVMIKKNGNGNGTNTH